jgi:peptide deformylase
MFYRAGRLNGPELTAAPEMAISGAIHSSPDLTAMAIRPILIIPDARLRAVADPIIEVDDDIKALAKDMLDTMYDAPGIGLAAPQIGVMKRIVVMDLAGEGEPPGPLVMINPEITHFGDQMQVTEEGCLSIPELYYEVERPNDVTVKYTDLEGKEVTKEAEGKLAVCIQHELDHLDGVLYIDYLSRLKRDRVIKKFDKQAKLAAR